MDDSPKQHLYLCPIGWIETDLAISTTDYEQLWAATSDCGSFSLQNRCNNVLVKDQQALCMTSNADDTAGERSVLPWCRIPQESNWMDRRPVFDISGHGCVATHETPDPEAGCPRANPARAPGRSACDETSGPCHAAHGGSGR